MRASLADIAKRAGVSAKTVSNILNCGKEHLYRPETRERVLAEAQRVNYRPHRISQLMRSKATKIIGFAAQNFSMASGRLEHYGVYPFLVGLNHRLGEKGYHTLLVEISELGTEGMPDVLNQRFFDGLVVHWGLAERFRCLEDELGMPIVWWDAGLFAPANCIDRNELAVGAAITRELIALGHEHIGFMLGSAHPDSVTQRDPRRHFSFHQRYEGYLSEIRKAGLKEILLAGYDDAAMAKQLKKERVTAALVTGGGVAHVMKLAAARLGWKVPQDFSIANCDVETRLGTLEGSFGGIPYDRYQTGRKTAEMILKRLENDGAPVPSEKFCETFTRGTSVDRVPVAASKS